MYDIWLYYKGNDVICARSVQKIVYGSGHTEITLNGDAIFTTQIPCTSDLFLIAENRSYSMSSKGLIGICVKEKSDDQAP